MSRCHIRKLNVNRSPSLERNLRCIFITLATLVQYTGNAIQPDENQRKQKPSVIEFIKHAGRHQATRQESLIIHTIAVKLTVKGEGLLANVRRLHNQG